MEKKGNIYFASDFHLGLNTGTDPLEREKKVVNWLKSVKDSAREIYLLGDIFDFWWEYRLVVPKGYTRFLGTVSEITDSGVPVHFFTGNHDMWVGDYLSRECGMTIHTEPMSVSFDGRAFHLAHGEGLGTKDAAYKVLLAIFRNKVLRSMYSMLHPSVGVGIGLMWSLNSRLGKGLEQEFFGEDKEDLIRYAKSILEKEAVEFFVFGHRHLAMKYNLREQSELVFLGDWIRHGSYAVWDGEKLDFIML